MKKINRPRLLDVGCGSGCIGITLKLEMPSSDITLCDISPAALKIAQENAENLEADVMLTRSDLLESVRGRYDIIVANLPYVDKAWERSPETDHEPSLALFAENGGLELIYKLIDQAPEHLTNDGYLFLEADPEQHADIQRYAKPRGFISQDIRGYALSLRLNRP
jgi:release factor glutamine methyltransferase